MPNFDAISEALAVRAKAQRGVDRWAERLKDAEHELATILGHHHEAPVAAAAPEAPAETEPEAEAETPAPVPPAPTANPFTPFSND